MTLNVEYRAGDLRTEVIRGVLAVAMPIFIGTGHREFSFTGRLLDAATTYGAGPDDRESANRFLDVAQELIRDAKGSQVPVEPVRRGSRGRLRGLLRLKR